jgi:hypothetical protein
MIPAGWTIERQGDEIMVCAPDANPGGTFLNAQGSAVRGNGNLAARVLYALADAMLKAGDAAGADNPTNLPPSLGVTVEDALRTALQVRGYRADGDTLTLARRCHFMALEDRDVIAMQKTLADRLKLRGFRPFEVVSVPGMPPGEAVMRCGPHSVRVVGIDTGE